jgi:hypothetical protein
MGYYKTEPVDEVFWYSESVTGLPSRDDKAVPDNFSSFSAAINDPNVLLLEIGDIIEVQDWLYELITPYTHFAPILTPITEAQALAFLALLVTEEEKLAQIKANIRLILDTTMQESQFFHGFGYELGRASVAMFPNEADAKILTAWHKAVLIQEAAWFADVQNLVITIDDLLNTYEAGLPVVTDFVEYGSAQQLVDKTAIRISGNVYTNLTKAPIQVLIDRNDNVASLFYINSVAVAEMSDPVGPEGNFITVMIPVGFTYSVELNTTIRSWHEITSDLTIA